MLGGVDESVLRKRLVDLGLVQAERLNDLIATRPPGDTRGIATLVVEAGLFSKRDLMLLTGGSDGSKPDVSLWRELTGQTPEDVKGEGWIDALHPDDREQALAAWRHALATSTPYSARYRLRRFDGEYRWFAARGAPVFLPDGTLSEWVGACVDIHDFIANPSDQSPGAPGPERMRLTGAHLRAGRGLLNWSVRDLADKAGFTSAVVRRFEECGEITTADPQLSALVTALERGGAVFVTIPDGRVALTPGLAGVSSRPLP